MLNVINQFKRIYLDDGRNDKIFTIQEQRLKWSLFNLRIATEKFFRTAQTLHDEIMSQQPHKLN